MIAAAEDFADDAELGAVIFSCIEAREEGRLPDRQQLKASYPQFAAELEEFFVNQDKVERFAAPLREVVLAAESRRMTGAETGPESAVVGGAIRGTLGDYDLIRVIGRGGMGVVYQAHQRGLNRLWP